MRKWKVEDDKRNSVVFIAPSKTQAKKMASQMMPGMKWRTVTDMGPAEPTLPRRIRRPEDFKAVEPIRHKEVKPGPNEPCPCGRKRLDGRVLKFKKCCGAKRRGQ